MNVSYEATEIIVSFIEMFLLFRIYGIILRKHKRRESTKQGIILAIIGTAIMHICNYIAVFSYFNILVFVLFTSITALFIYKINYVVLFSVSSFYMLCISCFDFLSFTLVSTLFGGYDTFLRMVSVPSIFRSVTIIIIKFFWIMIFFILKKYLYRFSLNQKSIYAFLIIALAGFTGFIYLVNQTFKSFSHAMTGMWLIFVVIFSLVFFVIYFVLESREEKMKLNFAEMRNSLLEENYQTINDIYMKNAKLYHDLNNHLNVLYQLLEKENVSEAKAYIREVSKPIMQLSKSVWTGIDAVDVIINSKVEKMKEKGIPVEVNVEFPDNTNILPHDMCTIISNLLDNAIEATEKLKDPGGVSLVIRRINHFLLIKVSNDAITGKKDFVVFPDTSKENKNLHGWGLPSVRDAVDKYNGSFKCTNRDGKFVVTIMLFYESR